jgi:hypothetical protein
MLPSGKAEASPHEAHQGEYRKAGASRWRE